MKINKKIVKLISIILVIFICFSCIQVQASSIANQIQPKSSGTGANYFQKAMNVTIGVFQVAAIGLGSIMLAVLGIKYMVSSPGEKAEIKKHATVYIVGAIMAFGATGVAELVKIFTESILA